MVHVARLWPDSPTGNDNPTFRGGLFEKSNSEKNVFGGVRVSLEWVSLWNIPFWPMPDISKRFQVLIPPNKDNPIGL